MMMLRIIIIISLLNIIIIKYNETTGKSEKSQPQMGFEPTTLRESITAALTTPVVRKGEIWVFNSSCITQPQSQIGTDSIAHNCIAQSH